MEDIVLKEYADGSKIILTTDSPRSHYGIPVVRCVDRPGTYCDFGPADPVPECLESPEDQKTFGETFMAEFVRKAAFACEEFNPDGTATEATSELIKQTEAWLRQWPEGPQHI